MECLTRLRRRCDLRRDEGNKQARRPSLYIFQAFIGAFLGILTLAKLDHSNAFTHTQLEESDAVMIVGSFGAQAVLLFAAPAAPLAQPWNCIVGNGISAFVGVSSYKLFTDVFDSDLTWVAAACAVSISIALMLYTKSVHPPGGATALIAVMGSDRIHALGYWYILFPAMLGSVIHVFIAVLWNNTSGNNTRAYPKHWWPVEVSPLPPSSPSLSFSPPESFRLPLPDSNHDTKDTDTHAANHRDACAGARTHTRTQKTDTQHEHNNVNVSMDDENEDYVEMNHIQMTQ